MTPAISVAISGEPKTGKTHFALTFPDPILVYSFDLRGAEMLINKDDFSGKEIDIHKYMPPIQDSLKGSPYAEDFWNRLRKDISDAVESKQYKTIVFDPSTVLWEIIRHAFQEEAGRKGLMSRDYGEPNARMTWCLTLPLTFDINVVSIQYLKDEYVDDKATGKQLLDGFKRTEGLVDVAIVNWIDRKIMTPAEQKATGYKYNNVVKSELAKCRLDLNLNGMELENSSYDELITLLGVAE